MKPNEQQLEPIIGKTYRINAGEQYEETRRVTSTVSTEFKDLVLFDDGTFMTVADWRSGVAAKEIVEV